MVSIICCTMRMDYMENVFGNYENQDWEKKKLTHSIIKQITGKNAVLFRPPFRSYNNKVLKVSKKLGYLAIMQSIRANESKQTSVEQVVSSVISRLGPGEIVVLHDSGEKSQQTVEAVKMILSKIQEKGYQCVHISKLAR